MKTSTSTYNPLEDILKYFPESTEEMLSLPQIRTVKGLLDLGGVHCEDIDEVVDCIELLSQVGLLTCQKLFKQNKTYYKVTKKNYG